MISSKIVNDYVKHNPLVLIIFMLTIWFALMSLVIVAVNLVPLSKENVIRNYTDMDSDGLRETIALLPKSYQKLGVRIEVYEDKEQYMKKNRLRHLLRPKEERETWERYMDQSKSFYDPEKKRVFIFRDKYPTIEQSEGPTNLLIAASLYHELRHAYQHEYEPEFLDEVYIEPGQDGYSEQMSEEDAELFTQKCMVTFHGQLTEIYDVDITWSYNGEGNLLIGL